MWSNAPDGGPSRNESEGITTIPINSTGGGGGGGGGMTGFAAGFFFAAADFDFELPLEVPVAGFLTDAGLLVADGGVAATVIVQTNESAHAAANAAATDEARGRETSMAAILRVAMHRAATR